MNDRNAVRWEVWHIDKERNEKRRLAAFHFRFHAEAFIEAISKHPGDFEIKVKSIRKKAL